MESHSAPPGYNPNVSMLQGGNAPILPVQGGGGIGVPPTTSYNPSVSLLEGGTGVIEAVKGGGADEGGAVTFAKDLENVNIYKKEENTRTANEFYSLEMYKMTESTEEAPKLESDDKSLIRRRKMYEDVSSKEGIPFLYKLKTIGSKKVPMIDTEKSVRGQYKDCKKRGAWDFRALRRSAALAV